MKLCRARVREFRSIWDSSVFEVGSTTCFVGKNEAGKSALLQALYRLNPIVESEGNFDVTSDYPRIEVENYQQAVEAGERSHATVVEATFALEKDELAAIHERYGPSSLARPEVVVSKGYLKDGASRCSIVASVPVVEAAVVAHLVQTFELPDQLRAGAAGMSTIADLARYLTDAGKNQETALSAAQASANQLPEGAERAAALEQSKALAECEPAKALRAKLRDLSSQGRLGDHIWESLLRPRLPKFLYFSEYSQLRGQENIPALKTRMATNTLQSHDLPLLGLIELARLDLDKLAAPNATRELKNKLEGASNYLSGQILKYWSQNKHLRMTFDVRPGLPGDPPGMQNGMNIWGEVFDSKHLVSTGLATRSTGFVWFFSFLAWYSSGKKKTEPIVLLLDEPGLSIHGRAQGDLLRFFATEVEANPNHQLLYTTHSPFMVDARHFDRVRIVQDNGIDSDQELPRDKAGTKVFTDVLEAGPDSLFPLQGALGYDIYQTLFVGPHNLIVEGVSDLLYLQTMSGILESKGRPGLDPRWTITPVGGSDKVPTFVALIGAQKNLTVATLIDFQKADEQTIENLYKKRLLQKSHVLTFADFTKTPEADIEDMVGEDLYLQLVNEEFSDSLGAAVKTSDLTSRAPRVLVRLATHFVQTPLKKGAHFNHYRPARLFAERAAKFEIPASTLDAFEAAFTAANALLGQKD